MNKLWSPVFSHSTKTIGYCVLQQEEDGFIHKLIIGNLTKAIEFLEQWNNPDFGHTVITTFSVNGDRLDMFNVKIEDIEMKNTDNVFTLELVI